MSDTLTWGIVVVELIGVAAWLRYAGPPRPDAADRYRARVKRGDQ